MNYKDFIEHRLSIVNKSSEEVPFILNTIQDKFLIQDYSPWIAILKARQQGFSSLILAMFTADFILKDNSRSVIIADIADNAMELLDRVKRFLKSYEERMGLKIPLKYNSRYELFNESTNARYTIGTADNYDFGRSKTITNLHLSEFAFYQNSEKILASALQAVVPDGRAIIETTANGFNFFKNFWNECERGERTFKPLFYPASAFYSPEFLERKKQELKQLFDQEYPESAEMAFITSGDSYFDKQALQVYLKNVKEPIQNGLATI